MRIITSIQFLLLLFMNSFASASVTEEQEKSYITVNAVNVGQGMCITAELNSPEYKKPMYLLFDGGSSAFKKELNCLKYFLEKQQLVELEKALKENRAEEYEVNSPPRTPTSASVPQSVLRAATPGESRALKTISSTSHKDIKDEMIKKIRTSLGMREHNSPIIVKTFFISHPDSDHYNLANEIFINNKDKIFNIILGGLPHNYSDSFRVWLQKQISSKKTRIYFPALALEQPISSIEEIVQQCEKLKGMMYSPLYAPQMFSDPREGWKPVDYLKYFEDALPFGKDIQTYLLSVNPTHWEDRGRIARGSFSEDDNSDSLVIKLQVGEHSIIITGDATELTTGRILGNYSESLDFLQTNILTSDHHGAKTHGSNNLPWIKATAPQHIIFSCGITHGHPSLYAYENSKQSPRLARTDPHDIWVWEGPEKKKGEKEEETYTKGRKVRAHTTHYSLFSTFSSGTLTLTLPEAGEISIESQILNFDIQKLGPKKQYKTLPAKEEYGSRSEEERIEISIGEDEFEELEKSILEEREAASALREPKSLFSSTTPYESPYGPSRKRIRTREDKKEEEGSFAPLMKAEQKAPLQEKERLASRTVHSKPISKEKSKKRLYKSSSDEEVKSQSKRSLDFEEEELIELKQTWSSKSSKESEASEERASLKLESSSKPKKKQGTKRKQIETVTTEERVKEKDPKNQLESGSISKDKPLKERASVTKAKKGQRESIGKLEKEKGTQPTPPKGKKGGKKSK